MRPYLLKGHEGPLTIVKYNADGDLIFSGAKKDLSACVWNSETGERLGTYEGHTGAIFSLDITEDSKILITASTDASVRIWDVMTGAELKVLELSGPVKQVAFAEGDREFATYCDALSGRPAELTIWRFDPADAAAVTPRLTVNPDLPEGVKLTRIAFLPGREGLLTGAEDGGIRVYDVRTGELMMEILDEHKGPITCIGFDPKKLLMITSSQDRSAKLWDVKTLEPFKTYKADVPLNAAAICPIMERVMIGGGQEARDVARAAVATGRFEARIHHMIFENELGTIKGHFGPLNTLAFHPDGTSYSSGGEDGYIRLHKLDPEFFTLGEEDALDDPILTEALEQGQLEALEREEEEARRRAEEEMAAVEAAKGGR